MEQIINNGDAAGAVASAVSATSANSLFVRGLIFMGISFLSTGVATKFMLEASRAAAIEAAEIAKLNAA